MITDMDNLPMNRNFFTKNIQNISENKWINLEIGELKMKYV